MSCMLGIPLLLFPPKGLAPVAAAIPPQGLELEAELEVGKALLQALAADVDVEEAEEAGAAGDVVVVVVAFLLLMTRKSVDPDTVTP